MVSLATGEIPISTAKLETWQRTRLGTKRASIPDKKSVHATLQALLSDAEIGDCVMIRIAYGEGGFSASVIGRGEKLEAARKIIEKCSPSS